MDPTLRLRRAERAAALLLGALSLFPFVFAVQTVKLMGAAAGPCEALCGLFGLMARITFALSVAGVGLACSIWSGTRLGPVVGAIVAGAVLADAIRSLVTLLGSGFGLGDEEVVGPLVVAVASAAAHLLLGASLVTWLRRLRSA